MKTNNSAEANVSAALVALGAARVLLFTEMGTLQRARRNRRIRETEWAICDAIKVADGRRGAALAEMN
jgi:hypothetical protein